LSQQTVQAYTGKCGVGKDPKPKLEVKLNVEVKSTCRRKGHVFK
jgi:hypothetical protein